MHCLHPDLPEIAAILQRRRWLLGSAESCTGGMIAAACTDLPGSSAWFAGGVVTYTIPWKERLLGVSAAVIGSAGVVSAATAEAMATGLLRQHGVNAAIATTGIAGPSGAEPGKPVGTVFIAATVAGFPPRTRRFQFSGSRAEVREGATEAALHMLLELLHAVESGSNTIK